MASASPQLSILTSVFRGEKYLHPFLEQLRNQSIFARLEFVLVLNEPSVLERKLARSFAKQYPGQAHLLVVDPVETLGASWNRAWRSARAPLLAIWNVDDRRVPDSLERQVGALNSYSDWALCYGDYVAVADYGQETGKRRYTPAHSRRFFRRAFPQGGGFWVFRKAIAEQIGYFDEQFQVAPDLDLSIRMAVAGLQMGRVDGTLGYFTDAEEGLSTRDGAARSSVERTAIQLRYGVYDKVRPELVEDAQAYRLDEILSFEDWRPLEGYLPHYRDYLKSRRWLRRAGNLRNAMRGLFHKMGVLDWLYGLQERYLKREV